MLKSILLSLVSHIAGLLHSVSASDIHSAIDLVIAAASKFSTNSERFQWVAQELQKVTDGLLNKDGAPTNKLNLLVSLAIDIARKFGWL